jgi:hypothetical protein
MKGTALKSNRAAPSRAALPAPARSEPTRAAGVHPSTFTARLAALDPRGRAWISWGEDAPLAHGNSRRAGARSTVRLEPAHVGREVLVTWANEPPEPVIVGLLQREGEARAEESEPPAAPPAVKQEYVVVESERELVLRCGAGSITLTADGKVHIRGLDVVSSAERTQRIRGGSVRIN